jgi:Reverse transcriptase (RNA-dependent DNA polymerase)
MLLHPHKEGFLIAGAAKEIEDLKKKETFKMVETPQATHIMPLKWVFHYKFDTDGYLLKYKTRICARGDLQRLVLTDTYAATLAAKTFRIMMAITAFFDLDADQLDAVTAFLNSKLRNDILCNPRRIWRTRKCWLLQRALYKLRRAPRLWQQNFRVALIEMGMQPVSVDQCLYTSEHLMIFYFVDDLVILCRLEDKKVKEQFKEGSYGKV